MQVATSTNSHEKEMQEMQDMMKRLRIKKRGVGKDVEEDGRNAKAKGQGAQGKRKKAQEVLM